VGKTLRHKENYYDRIICNDRVELNHVDLTQERVCERVTKSVDGAVLANAVSFGASFIENNPLGLVNDNVIMNVRLLEACHKNVVRHIVYFGSTTGYPDSDAPMREEDMFKGDPYPKYFGVGWMKRYTEKLLELYCNLGLMNATVLRLSNVYGPFDKFDLETSHVLPAMIRKFAERRFPLEVWGDGTVSRDFIYSYDVARAVYLSLVSSGGFRAFNIGAGENYTVNETINILCQLCKVRPEIKYLSGMPQMIPARHVDVSKARDGLGFEPKVNIEDGIMYTYNWLQEQLGRGNIYR
jgi:GDP-L-fucose synthase